MGVFTLGNLITLIVVVIILAVFRQLDKNNRSLEKVKRYSDKVKGELDEFVEQKAIELKDLTIDIDVHKQTIKEVFSRLTEAEEGMAEKAEKMTEIQGRIDEYDNALDDLAQMTSRVDENLKRLQEESEFVDNVGKQLKDAMGKVAELESSLPSMRDEFSQSNTAALEKGMQNVLADARDRVENIRMEMDENEKLVNNFTDYITALEAKKDNMSSEAQEDLKEVFNKYLNRAKQVSETMEQEYHQKIQAVAERAESLEDEVFLQLKAGIDEKAEEVRKSYLETIDTIRKDVSGIEKRVGSLMGEMETRIQEYEGDVAYRFEKLEEVGSDIDNLESALRRSLEDVVNNIRNDFAGYRQQLDNERKADKQRSDNHIQDIQRNVDSLDQTVSDLKSRAYENVSEKLKVFEDDFFADLRERDEELQQQFAQWKDEISSRLEQLKEEEIQKRGDVEKQYAEELKARISDVQGKTLEQLDRFENQVSAFQQGIEQKIQLTETSLQGHESNLKKEIQEMENSSRNQFEKQFASHNANVQEEMKNFEREMENKLEEMNQNFINGKKDVMTLLETAESDVTVWQAEVLKKMQDAEAETKEQFTSFKTETNMTIGEIRDSFNTQRDELITGTQEERERLKKELESIAAEIRQFQEDFSAKTQSAIEDFESRSNGFVADFQKRTRDLQTDLDQKIKDFRLAVQDTREKIDSVQKKMATRIEDSTSVLNVNLQEIEKKQKNFIAQTKIFERADSLKIGLQQNIEDLRAEIAVVEVQAKEMKEAERNFSKIKKLGDEVNAKMGRFLAEKRRIDEMEGDFKKLINLSQAVDLKLGEVTTSHDELQKVQAEIRNLEDLSKDVASKYERLEEKDKVIESTIKGIDKNFQKIDELDEQIRALVEDVNTIPDKMKDISKNIEELSLNKDKATTALNKLEELDRLSDELEEKLTTIQKGREWLGRTETRLEQVAKQSEEQLKLLGTLMKDGGKSGRGKDEAPSTKIRNMVRQLAHQGWGVNEIAKQTELSRGEVELILELLPKT